MANTDYFIQTKVKRDVELAGPPKCPRCRSAETSSAAKRPTADSYWRCLRCGDVFSPALLNDASRRGMR